MTSVLEQVLSSFKRRDIIKFRDAGSVEKILSKIVDKGSEFLQVIADFDMTLTRYHINGKPCETTVDVIARSHLMPQEFQDKNLVLYKKYSEIEKSKEFTMDEKQSRLAGCYSDAIANITSSGIHRSFLMELVSASTCTLRDNARYTLKMLQDANIPILILSAGLGDPLEEVLRLENVVFPNQKIVANFIEFDEKGHVLRFKEPFIHPFNKGQIGSLYSDYFANIYMKNNVLLLGDSIDDHDMDTGVQNPDGVLKIGFLNSQIEDHLSSFLDVFDIVIIDGESLDFVNLLLKFILQK